MQPGSSQSVHFPAQHKVYENSAIAKGFKDKQHETKERADVDSLKMALAFVNSQVQEKRRKLEELAKSEARDKFDLKNKKSHLMAVQNEIGHGTDKM